MLRLVNVNSYYGLIRVLKNLSLHVSPGEIVTLIGANGAGKSTTLRAISGLQPVREGQIHFEGREITGVSPERIVRQGIAQVPEGRQIFWPMTVLENLEIGGYLVYRLGGKVRLRERIEEMFDRFPILRERRRQFAGTLSGGEQQMLAIAMALINQPRFLLLDEPSMGLAPLVVREIFKTVKNLNETEGLTVLLVEQNARAALQVAHRGYVMETGKIVFEESAEALMRNQEVRRAYLGRDKREIWE